MKKFRSLTILISLCALGATAYLVKKGDTLWDLSGQFLANPFVWPDLWQNNPQVQDPHWIYPGDSLCIPGQEGACTSTAQQASTPSEPAPVRQPCVSRDGNDSVAKGIKNNCGSSADRDADFKNQLGALAAKVNNKEESQRDSTTFIYNKRTAPKLFNIYYQRLSPRILPLRDHKNEPNWSTVQSGEKKPPQMHSLEHELVLGYGKSTHKNLKIGDIAEIWLAEKKEAQKIDGSGTDEYALLRLAAYARISAMGDSFSRATIVQSFRQLDVQKAKSRPYQPLKSLEVAGFTPVTEVQLSAMGDILLAMDASLVIGQYAYVMVNKGTQDGFTPGCGIAFWEEDKTKSKLPPNLLGKGIVARSSKNESAVLVRELYSHQRRLEIGHKVSLTHIPVLQ